MTRCCMMEIELPESRASVFEETDNASIEVVSLSGNRVSLGIKNNQRTMTVELWKDDVEELTELLNKAV